MASARTSRCLKGRSPTLRASHCTADGRRRRANRSRLHKINRQGLAVPQRSEDLPWCADTVVPLNRHPVAAPRSFLARTPNSVRLRWPHKFATLRTAPPWRAVAAAPGGGDSPLMEIVTRLRVSAILTIWVITVLTASVGKRARWRQNPELVARAAARQTGLLAVDDTAAIPRISKSQRERLGKDLVRAIVGVKLNKQHVTALEAMAVIRVLLDTYPTDGGPAPQRYARHVAALVHFASTATNWRIDKARDLLYPQHLAQFMSLYATQVGDATYNDARRLLIRLGRSLFDKDSFREIPSGRRLKWSAPASETDVEEQWTASDRYPDMGLRRLLLLLICLCRGAGLRSYDLRFVHRNSIQRRPGGRTVVVIDDGRSLREAPVLRRYAQPLHRLLPRRGTGPLFERVVDNGGLLDRLRRLTKQWNPCLDFPNPNELANAYYLEIAHRRVPVARLLHCMGTHRSVRGLEDLRSFMCPEALRGPDDLDGHEDIGIDYFTPPIAGGTP